MPLTKGAKAKSKKGISANISKCTREGRPNKQCVAISMRLAGKPKPKKRKAATKRKGKK